MKVAPVITEVRAHCPIFEGRVAGAAEFRPLPEDVALTLPCAYVIPEPDSVDRASIDTGYRQEVSDNFSVVAVLPNADKRGQDAWDMAHDARAEIWRTLVGWDPGGDYQPCYYTGGAEVIHMDRARLYIAYDFAVDLALGHDNTRQGADLDALPDIDQVNIDVDVLDPAYDPHNVVGRPTHNPDQPNPRTYGPDGRIEAEIDLDIPTE